MKKINISEVISQACELTKNHWATILVCYIAIFLVQGLVSVIFGGTSQLTMLQLQQQAASSDPNVAMQAALDALQASLGASLVSSVISFILSVGLYQTVLNCSRGQGDFTINAWKQPAALYVKTFVASIIVGIIILIGLFCCILPGIYLNARLRYYLPYMLDHKDCGVMDGIEASWNATKENGLTLFLLEFVYALIGIVGFLCCFVGLIPAMIVIIFGAAVCYLTLMPTDNAPTSEPQSEYQK